MSEMENEETMARRPFFMRGAAVTRKEVETNLARRFSLCRTPGCRRAALVEMDGGDEPSRCYACARDLDRLEQMAAERAKGGNNYGAWALRQMHRFEWVFVLAFVAWGVASLLAAAAADYVPWFAALKNTLTWGK